MAGCTEAPAATASPLLMPTCNPYFLFFDPTRAGPGWASAAAPQRLCPSSWPDGPFPSDPLSVLQRLRLLNQHTEQDSRLQLLGSGRHRLSGRRAKLHFQRAEILPSLHLQSLWKPGKVCECWWCGNRKRLPVDQWPEMDTEEKLAETSGSRGLRRWKVFKWWLFSLNTLSFKIKSIGF